MNRDDVLGLFSFRERIGCHTLDAFESFEAYAEAFPLDRHRMMVAQGVYTTLKEEIRSGE